MPKMWRGPSAEFKAARSDPVFQAIARRAGRQGINFQDLDAESGCSIMVFAIERAGGRCGTWFRHDLGRVHGPNPFSVMLAASHAYTEHDAELFTLHSEYVTRELERLDDALGLYIHGLNEAFDEFLAIFE